MAATVIALHDRVRTRGDRTRATVHALKGYRNLTDQQIGEIIGWTRQKVQSYCAGPTKFTDEAFAAFGVALGVPEHVLLMDRDDALRWVLDNPSGGGPGGQEVSRRACNGGQIISLRARRAKPTPLATKAA